MEVGCQCSESLQALIGGTDQDPNRSSDPHKSDMLIFWPDFSYLHFSLVFLKNSSSVWP